MDEDIKMKILVTGANGYLGQGVVKAFLDSGNQVVAACHSETNGVDSRANIIQCDLYHIDKVNNQSLSETRLFSYIGDYLPSPPKTTLVKRYLDIRSPCTHSGYE